VSDAIPGENECPSPKAAVEPRAARNREQAAYKKAQEEGWKARADTYFAFLHERYGFEITQAGWSVWVTSARYETDVTAIDVERSVEFDRVKVLLIRKVDGAIPEYPIFVSTTPTLHYFLLDAVLDERAPEFLAEIQAAKGSFEEQIERRLKLWSRALETYADDILRGDLTLFTTLEAKLRARLREHPEVITVHVPADTPAEQIAHIEQRAGEPTGTVPVIVRKYQPPTARRKKQPGDTEQPRS